MCEHCKGHHPMHGMHHDQGDSFLRGAFLGTIVGAIIGFLYAPAKGSETRKKVMDEAEKLKEKMEPMVKEAKEKVDPVLADAKEKLQDIKPKLEQMKSEAEPYIDDMKVKINKTLEEIDDEINKQKTRTKKGFFKGLN